MNPFWLVKRYGRPISKPLLSKNHRKERLCFACRNKNTDWNKVIFTDESTFQLFYNPEKIWMKRRKKLYFRKVKHPAKIHVWGVFQEMVLEISFSLLICLMNL